MWRITKNCKETKKKKTTYEQNKKKEILKSIHIIN
jgi:hypothetical protein